MIEPLLKLEPRGYETLLRCQKTHILSFLLFPEPARGLRPAQAQEFHRFEHHKSRAIHDVAPEQAPGLLTE